jgi:hypothetical protein
MSKGAKDHYRFRGERNRPAKALHQEDRMFFLPHTVRVGRDPANFASATGSAASAKEDPTSVLMHAIESFDRFATFSKQGHSP